MSRATPYTPCGNVRAKCTRCGEKAKFQWNACADGRYRPLCPACDVALNALTLEFMRIPNWRAKMRRYTKFVFGT